MSPLKNNEQGSTSSCPLSWFALFLVLVELSRNSVCVGYAIQGFVPQPGFQAVGQQGSPLFQPATPQVGQFGPSFPQWQGSPIVNPSENLNNYAPPTLNIFTSPHSEEPLSFTHPIIYANRNVPVFENVVVTNKVDPVFAYENYVSFKPKPVQQVPPFFRPFQYQPPPLSYPPQQQFFPQTVSTGYNAAGMLNGPQPHQWMSRQGPPPPPGSVATMMTQHNTGGGILFSNPRYISQTPNMFTRGQSSSFTSRSSGGVLPPFRTIRKAPPGSFFIPVRGRNGSITYAPEPTPDAPEHMWSTDPKFTVGAISPSEMDQFFPPPLPPPPPPISKNTRNNYQTPSRSWGDPSVPFVGFRYASENRGQQKNREHFYPFPSGYYYAPPPSGGYIDNDIIYLGHSRQQTDVPSWLIPNFINRPIPNMSPGSNSNNSIQARHSQLVRQNSNYSPMQINPPLLMEPAVHQPLLFSQGRSRSIQRKEHQLSRSRGSEELEFANNNIRKERWVPQPPQLQGTVPQFPQNPTKPNGFGPQTYQINDQNRQLQTRPQQQQQQFLPPFPQAAGFDPQRGPQAFSQQQSWSSGNAWNVGGGPFTGEIRPLSQPRPFARGGEIDPNGFPNPAVAGSPRPGEQGIKQGPVQRVDQRPGWGQGGNENNNFPITNRLNSRPEEFGGQQYQIWKTNFANPYEHKEPTDHPQGTKAPLLLGSGGEVQVYSKPSSNQKYDGSLPRNNETKTNYKFTSDSTILQRHLQQAKQVLREQKSREGASKNSTANTTTKPKSSQPHNLDTTKQSVITKPSQLGDKTAPIPNSRPSSSDSMAATATIFNGEFIQPKPNFIPTPPRTPWEFGNSAIPPTRNAGPTPTNAASGLQQLPQQQPFAGQQFFSPPQSPTYVDFPTDISKHGRVGRHVEGLSFTSAEDLLAMDLEPLDLEESNRN